jgi:signal peptidase II
MQLNPEEQESASAGSPEDLSPSDGASTTARPAPSAAATSSAASPATVSGSVATTDDSDLMDTRPETPISMSSHPGPSEDGSQFAGDLLGGDVLQNHWGQSGLEDGALADKPPVELDMEALPSDPSTGMNRSSFPASRSFPPISDHQRPSFLFLGIVAALSLFADISTKVWAEIVINQRGFEPIPIIGHNVNITLAYNQGGAWGLFASADKMVRLPFFLSVSVFAIFFIVSLYARLHPAQKALKWGLPLVLGGALGNLSDRITRSQVIDFIDYKADWVMNLNAFINQYVPSWTVTDHWPTFNVADIAICVGVALMGVDMLSHRQRPAQASVPPAPPSGSPPSGSPSSTTEAVVS